MSAGNDDKFDKELLESLSHMRDVSLRDGIQSWDANKWPIENILPCVEALNDLAKEVKNRHGTFAPVELWGGGQVLQPAKFLKEDPLINLEQIHAAGPDLDLQCLYRGRQCFGFKPVSAKVQEEAIAATADRGMKVFRIFDMMNDPSNLEAGFNAIKKYRDSHWDKGIIIEGAVAFITEPTDRGPRVWSHQDYADYAVKLAEMGADEIAIKNYAGVGHKEMPDLIRTIRKTLAENGFKDKPVNLHMHGRNPEILAQSLEAGASKVDVAFGALSDGPSHSNAVDTLKELMRQKGFDVDGEYKNSFEHHAVVRQMRRVEKTIETQLEATKLKDKRPPEIAQEDLERYRMAGGAIGDVWANRASKASPDFYLMHRKKNMERYHVDPSTLMPLPQPPLESDFTQNERSGSWLSGPSPGISADTKYQNAKKRYDAALPQFKKDIYKRILEACPELWEKAGRFNTVTPGALILSMQAQQTVQHRIAGVPESMMDYTEPYMNVVVGRYGENKGTEKLEEAGKFRKAVLMFRALRALNESTEVDPAYTQLMLGRLAVQAGIRGVTTSMQDSADGKSKLRKIALDAGNLETILASGNLDEFTRVIRSERDEEAKRRGSGTSAKLQMLDKMLAAATPGKFPDPQEGLEVGHEIVRHNEETQKTNVDELRNGKARISSRNNLALLAMMLRQDGKFGDYDDAVVASLVEKAKDGPQSMVQVVAQSKGAGAGQSLS